MKPLPARRRERYVRRCGILVTGQASPFSQAMGGRWNDGLLEICDCVISNRRKGRERAATRQGGLIHHCRRRVDGLRQYEVERGG
jgi:hypothetical protein